MFSWSNCPNISKYIFFYTCLDEQSFKSRIDNFGSDGRPCTSQSSGLRAKNAHSKLWGRLYATKMVTSGKVVATRVEVTSVSFQCHMRPVSWSKRPVESVKSWLTLGLKDQFDQNDVRNSMSTSVKPFQVLDDQPHQVSGWIAMILELAARFLEQGSYGSWWKLPNSKFASRWHSLSLYGSRWKLTQTMNISWPTSYPVHISKRTRPWISSHSSLCRSPTKQSVQVTELWQLEVAQLVLHLVPTEKMGYHSQAQSLRTNQRKIST